MGERGYSMSWPANQAQTARVERAAFGLRKAYGARADVDAQMDVNFGFVGYAAAGAGKSGHTARPCRHPSAWSVRTESRTCTPTTWW